MVLPIPNKLMKRTERWRDVIGYEGLYQVSDWGRVRSMDRVVSHNWSGTQVCKGRILSLRRSSKTGKVKSLSAQLWKAGVRTTKPVHRLVLEAWVGPCPDGCEGCHNDGDGANNVVSNLRWDTRRNNQLDRRRHGTFASKCVKRSDGIEFESLSQAAEYMSCVRSSIWKACNGHLKTVGGYGWTYL